MAVAVIVTAGVMFAIGPNQQTEVVVEPSPPQIVYVNKTISEFFEGTQEVRPISSESELREILSASNSFDGFNRGFPTDDFFVMEESMEIARAMPAGEPVPMPELEPSFDMAVTSQSKSGSDGGDFSTTNVQVENVDEPDYLKNDAKYVYIVSQNTLTIIDAYPAESAEIVLKIALDIESQWIQNMFLNEDRLVIFYNGQSQD